MIPAWRQSVGSWGWEKLAELPPHELAAWYHDELEGRGLRSPRDDADPADVLAVLLASPKASATTRAMLQISIASELMTRVRQARTGRPTAQDLLSILFAARSVLVARVRPDLLDLEELEVAVFDEPWSRWEVSLHQAPHPVRHALVRVLLVCDPSVALVRKVLLDSELRTLVPYPLFPTDLGVDDGEPVRAPRHRTLATAALLVVAAAVLLPVAGGLYLLHRVVRD